ncbi:MAG: WD40 repeat domain-containing protein, partial [Verrucomicrobiia bacterium]
MTLIKTIHSTVVSRRRFSWILVLAATVFINASGLCQQAGSPVLEDESRMWEEFKAQVRALVDTENFSEVDKLADELRRTRTRWPGGTLKLEFLYTAYQRTIHSEDEWQRHFSRLELWVKSNPNSVAARILLGEAYTSYAWVARGTGFAYTVTDDGRKLFEERLQKAREVLEAAGRLSTKDAAVYWTLGRVALGQSWPREQLEALFQKGIAIEPDWYQMYFVKAYNLLPRWHGKPGEWVKFAEQAAEMTRREQGESLYARIVWFMMNAVGGTLEFKKDEGFFTRNGISWPKLKQGFMDIEKRYPGSLRTVNTFCQFACLAGDADTARSLFARLGDRWDADVWTTWGSFEKWRVWSAPPTPRVRTAASATLRHRGIVWDAVTSIAYSPDGRTLAAANWEGAVVLWDVGAQKVKTDLRGLPGNGRYVAFSPDSRLLAVTISDDRDAANPGEIRMWEAASGKEMVRFSGQRNPACALAFSPDGKTLITGGGHPDKVGEVVLWDLTSFRSQPLDLNLNRIVRSIAVSPDGQLLAYTYGQCAAVWDLKNNRSVFHKLPPNGHEQRTHVKLVSCLAFSPDGRMLATADDSGTVRLWSSATGELLPASIKGHTARVNTIAFSPDGKTLATCSHDETAKLWDVNTGQELLNIVGHYDRVHDLAFSPDGRTLATASSDGTVRLWDLSSVPAAISTPVAARQALTSAALPSVASPPVPRPSAGIVDLRYSTDGRTLAVVFAVA